MMAWRDCSTSPCTLSSLLWPSLLSSALCPVPGGASPGETETVTVCVCAQVAVLIFLLQCFFK